MKALKIFIVVIVTLFVSSTTLAFKSSAVISSIPLYFNTNFISSFVAIAKTPLTNSEDTIQDGLQNDYLQQVLSEVLDLKSGKVGEIINLFTEANQNWNWTVQEGILPASYNGTTQLLSGEVLTTLDGTKLSKATNLAVARTMIHEMVHAYLTTYFKYDPVNAAKDYPQILRAWVTQKNPDYNEIQHDEIEKSFVEYIAMALKEYSESMSLSFIDDSVYTDLAWGGLDFKNNSQLTDEDKERIQLRLSAEQLNKVFSEGVPVGITTARYTII